MSSNINLSNNLCNKIDQFIKKLSCNIPEDKEIIKDFEDEMKINLESSILELINDGHSEKEAFEIATKRFGDIKEMEKELTEVFPKKSINDEYNEETKEVVIDDIKEMEKELAEVFPKKSINDEYNEEAKEVVIDDINKIEEEIRELSNIEKKIHKMILMLSVISLMISLVLSVGYKISYEKNSLKLPKELKTAVLDKLEKGENISEEEVIEIFKKHKNKFRYVSLYKTKDYSFKNIVYPTNFSEIDIKNDNDTLTAYVIPPDGTEWGVRFGFDESKINWHINEMLLITSRLFLILYWGLFSSWSIIYAFKLKKLNIIWAILFIILNVVGFAIFKMQKI